MHTEIASLQDLTDFIVAANPRNRSVGQFHNQVVMRFPNNFGVSIIEQSRFEGDGLFEVAVIRFNGISNQNWDFVGDPTGFHNAVEVREIITRTMNKVSRR